MRSAMKDLLELVETKQITPEEGQRRLAELRGAQQQPTPQPGASHRDGSPAGQRIAVIGLSTRYAGAGSPDALWRLLAEGECAVTEVPPERWRPEDYYDPDPRTPGRTNSRWGAFVKDVAAFDPLFFHLSGREAERMDPQQRLFLEGCWNALEDSGYAGDSLAGSSCGVFVGTPASDYPSESQRSGPDADAQVLLGNDTSILASRISYLLDLRGPSVALNTACSSSLVALDLACQAIRSGQCEMALAGGVCLFVGPGFYVSASKAGMLSPRGRCSAFDQDADGFVPGEGCGVVVLKSLDAALRDGDHIRGVILGSAVNQDGKSNGITAPSSRAQTEVQLQAYEQAGINPRTISLIEAHGTGTALGDPIEIEALTRSFARFTDEREFCAIGSVKSNLGHTGQAAGVAGLIKCLLAFEHEQIPPTLHFSAPNQRITFAETPFRPVTSLQPWPRREDAPRRAAVSSFGYSGTNAHVVVEEPPAPAPAASAPAASDRPQLVLVSARTEDALRRRLEDLGAWLDARGAAYRLEDIAHTLHEGRKHFEMRVALVADTTHGLRRSIQEALDAEAHGSAARLSGAEKARLLGMLRERLADVLPGSTDHARALKFAADLYERGITLPVRLILPVGGQRRVPLPTYPFERDHYWHSDIAVRDPSAGPDLEELPSAGGAAFRFRARPGDPLVADHVVGGRHVLAGMVSLELARAAAARAGFGTQPVVEQVTWHRPVVPTGDDGVEIVISQSEDGTIRFRVDPPDASTGVAGATGVLSPRSQEPEDLTVDIEAVRARCTSVIDREDCYRRFTALGFTYGPSFRVVRELRFSGDEVLARLELPEEHGTRQATGSLRPTLLDGALQALVALAGDDDRVRRVPYALRRLTVHTPLGDSCYARLRRRDDGVLDVEVLDDAGAVLVTMDGFEVLESREPEPATPPDLVLFSPEWQATGLPTGTPQSSVQPVLVLDTESSLANRLRAENPGRPVVLVTPGEGFRSVSSGHYVVRPDSTEDYARLLAALPEAERPTRILLLSAARTAAGTLSSSQMTPLGRPDGLRTLFALTQALGATPLPGPVAVRTVYPAASGTAPELAALGAFARTVRRENPDLCLQTIGLPTGIDDSALPNTAWDLLLADASADEPVELRLEPTGTAERRTLRELPAHTDTPTNTVRTGHTYLITGGTGHLGLAVARHLAADGARLVLISRSDPGAEARKALRSLREDGAEVVHLRADVSDRSTLGEALREVRSRYGPLHGIVHAAGVIRDSFLLHKTVDEIRDVLGAKCDGAMWLDDLTREDPLEFLVFFSSVVATVGNPGQSDYAYANGFLDEFAEARETWRREGRRNGRTLSIAWPAWGGGGMAGALPSPDVLGVDEGLRAFEQALGSTGPRIVVVKGQAAATAVAAVARQAESPVAGPHPAATEDMADGEELRQRATTLLSEILAEELRVPAARIDPETPFDTYGIDSVMVIRLSERLEREFGPLPKTLFFQYANLFEMAGHLVRRYRAVLKSRLFPDESVADEQTSEEPAVTQGPSAVSASAVEPTRSLLAGTEVTAETNKDIAVIGVAGRYPMAGDVEEFWHNLVEGRDCVTTVPADRWPLEGFYDPEGGPGRSYAKWGGFLDGIDRFDPLFFGIAPRDADMMDPQERVFLETVWHALEDSGRTRADLREGTTGVFVGVMYGDYQRYGPAPDGRMGVSSYASIANRVSYFFDFRGPSMALDTMCSSSLTAIHLASESLRRGECDTAVAGGVNLSTHPDKYRQLSLARFLSTDGRCRSFGAGGDGYVPGEGAGALLLKPLGAALRDGDTVHAIIRGSAVNHGGRTNGYTVPSTRSQSAAIIAAMHRAGVRPEEIGYVEAHGTGTALGDPIEVAALTEAFHDRDHAAPTESGPDKARRIPIGSVKSAIGHLESAAGVAAVTKVILQMRHRTLVPSLHAERLNPDVDLEASPFRLQRELSPWTPRGDGRTRWTAGVSSFGAGGSNAHLILEAPTPPEPQPGGDTDGLQVLLLSAKSPDRLTELASRLADRLDSADSGHDAREHTLASKVTDYLTDRLGDLLGLRPGDLGQADDLAECGFDEVTRVRLGTAVAEYCGLPSDELPRAAHTVEELADHLIGQHEGALRSRFGIPADRSRPAPAQHRLGDIAYTLQVGREAMSERVAVVTDDLVGAVRGLRAFAEGRAPAAGVFVGSLADESDGAADSSTASTDSNGPEALAQRWVRGAEVNWRSQHAGHKRRIVPLVGYPFARERHWLDTTSQPGAVPAPEQSLQDDPEVTMDSTADTGHAPREHGRELRSWLERTLTAFAGESIGLAPERINRRTALGEYGFESVSLKALADRISSHLGVALSPTLFYERRGVEGAVDWLIEEYADRLASRVPHSARPEVDAPAVEAAEGAQATVNPGPGPAQKASDQEEGAEPIAVIGMSGRFPGSRNLADYWENLYHCRDMVTEVPADRWDWQALDSEDLPPQQRTPYRWGGFIEGADTFDPLFFGISPAEAEMMDPQQRVLLQTVWTAIEDAGYRPSALAGHRVGLFSGIQFSDYQHLMHEAGVMSAQSGLGNEHSISVNRISYLLDFHGPSEPVNTACSSSLVAVHRAVRSLRQGESELALAGGISLNLSPHSTVAAGMMGLLSPDGRCKTLDARANGYVKGEGVGMLVLKPLARALADGDQIHAVIRGTAVNHGGRAASLTAPNAEAQADLLCTAVDEAGVGPESIGYVELHGTGTELGDPVEINGIKLAFRRLARKRGVELSGEPFCGIGSVKTNIGHLEPASGIAGLMKIILAMRHRALPGMVHLDQVNPYVDLEGSPFRIVDRTTPWEPRRGPDGSRLPLRAGVSSFGFGGVNAHVLLDEAPARTPHTGTSPVGGRVFVFSARTDTALTRSLQLFVDRLGDWELPSSHRPDIDTVAFTLREGREEMKERLAVVAPDLSTLRDRLVGVLEEGADGSGVHRGSAESTGEDGGAFREGEAPLVTGTSEQLARAWVTGRPVDWTSQPSAAGPALRTALPTYPFEEKRFWFTPPEAGAMTALPAVRRPSVSASGSAGSDGSYPEESLTGEEYIRAGLRGILLEKLKLAEDELDEDRDLKDFGVDSMLSAMIMQVVQEAFDVQVPLTALVDYPTLRSLSTHIHEEFFADQEIGGVLPGRQPSRAGQAPAPDGKQSRLPAELLPINIGGEGQPSFWVHGATGYSTWFQNLSQALGPDYPLYAFQARGTDGYSMPHTLDEMVDHYIACIRQVQPEGPYVLGGYSFGGLIAMRMAQRLHDEGEQIRHLVMFDTYPATQEVFDRHHGMYDRDFLQLYLTNYFLRLDEHPERAVLKEDVAHLPAPLQVAELARMAKERGDRRVAADDIYLYLRGGLTCSEQAEGIYQIYEMKDYTASDVLFFKATDGFTGRASALYWKPTRILDGYDYETPWRDVVQGEFEVAELDNDHLNQLEEPTLTLAARRIEGLLKQPAEVDKEGYAAFRDDFDALTAFGNRLLAHGFRGADVLPEDGSPTGRAEMRSRLGVQPAYDRLFNASCDILEREGFVQQSEDGGLTATKQLTQAAFPGGTEEIEEKAAELAVAHPSVADYVPLLVACQGAVFEVMAGRRDATDVIFPGGSMELVAEIYKGSIQSEFYNRLVAEVVEEHTRHFARRYSRSQPQIFEVGAGTGGTSTFVFDALKNLGDRVRYHYTDIGGAFLRVAEQQFGPGHPYVEFDTFDIERSPLAQGYEPGTMDVVVASNVLHTTRSIDVTLAHCRQLLKPGGIVVINELTHRLDYNTLTFGLTTGWWLFKDEDERVQGSPLLDTRGWRNALRRAGFDEVEIRGLANEDETDQAQCVIVAKAAKTP
ncbi:SDR family NAD(P)-dependent oxidoreductase [Streptomyces cyaneofuscatus]|uniref:SDR family NAD(P)-dependent oxidoreductase n=1 Tax=Streptomyces cyaneofuscatus TaxID=66883 RepID=UPI0037D10E26